jgi:hypothetical protein
MKSRAIIPVILVLALAAAAAGCGGSGGGGGTTTTPSMTKQQFAAKITEICAKGQKKIAKVGLAIGSTGSLANSGQEVADLELEQINKFKRLQPPEEIKSQVEDFISKAETSFDKLEALVQAAKNFQAENVEKLTPEAVAAGQAVHTAAKTFGATC